MTPVSDYTLSSPRRRVAGLVLLALLLIAGQWQVSWHAMFHLPDAVTQTAAAAPDDGADRTPPGHAHATGHCDDCAPVQLAMPSHQPAPAPVAPTPGWLTDTGRPWYDASPPPAYYSRAPPLSA